MKKGYFAEFGGCFVPELLMPPLQELEEAMRDIMPSPTFKEELDICSATSRDGKRP